MRPSGNAAVAEQSRGFDWTDLERSSVVAAVATTSSGRIVWANSRFRELLAVPAETDIVGKNLEQWLEEPAAWPASQADRGTGGRGIELRIRREDHRSLVLRGDVLSTEIESAGTYLLGILADVSEVEQLHSAMRRSARLETVGCLTSGIAHDFNNLLTVLVGNLALLAEELRADPEKFAKLKAARDAATRGSDLIRQLLAFAREQPVESDLINPAKVVGKITPLIDRALGSGIELETRLDAEAGSVRGNTAQLESVVVNLAVNARDALESGGRVRITVREQQLDAGAAAAHGLAPGTYLSVRVADNGSGIAEDALERVFEPFFSTKLDRGGNGLGLSMVRTYAEQFNGAATIRSVVGKGTEVSLLFPKIADGLEDSVAMTMPLSTLPTGEEALLVVAPEEGMRSTVVQILSVLGYKVRAAETLGDANRMMRDAMPDLLIVDGFDARVLLGVRNDPNGTPTDCRTIQLATGSEAADVEDPGRIRALVKPFSLADLAGAVRATLDGES